MVRLGTLFVMGFSQNGVSRTEASQASNSALSKRKLARSHQHSIRLHKSARTGCFYRVCQCLGQRCQAARARLLYAGPFKC
eukprot:SAG11_NODE_12402_length_705_cov_1.429043_2_plen_80_part_01